MRDPAVHREHHSRIADVQEEVEVRIRRRLTTGRDEEHRANLGLRDEQRILMRPCGKRN